MKRNPHETVARPVNWGGFEQFKAADPLRTRRVLALADIGAEEPRLLTVRLHRLGTDGLNIDWRAFVTWGAGKLTQQMYCDFGHGTSFTVPTSGGLVVEAVPFTPRAVSMSTQGLDLVLGATAGFGGASGVGPYYTSTLPLIAAGASSAVLVPPAFSRAVSIYPGFATSTVDGYQYLRTQWQFPDGGSVAYVQGDVLAGGAAMPVPAIANLVIANTHGADDMIPTVVWHLQKA